jgi:hypothetical protein
MRNYTGSISRKSMPPIVAKAYKSWESQRQRAKKGGYTVSYSSREFINWWLKEIKKRSSWLRPSVNRIDHSKGYSFDNIFLEETSFNTAERNRRYTRAVKIYKNTRLVFTAHSIAAAAKWAKVQPNNIPAVCKKLRRSLGGYRFEYVSTKD